MGSYIHKTWQTELSFLCFYYFHDIPNRIFCEKDCQFVLNIEPNDETHITLLFL